MTDPEDRYAAVDRAAEANALHRPVVIEDGVVSRPAGEHTATVHSYLRHLRAQGLECVPEPLGVADGTETLRFIEGADGGDGWWHQHTDQWPRLGRPPAPADPRRGSRLVAARGRGVGRTAGRR